MSGSSILQQLHNQTWRVHNVRTTAGEQHGRDLAAERSVWNVDVAAPAIVLGSRQTESELDLEACVAAGVEVVRRRSGGGMVFLSPENQIWLDVVIPKNDALWSDDVGRASWWVGEAWLGAVESLGADGLHVHRDNLATGVHGGLICFAGAGPGEVMSSGTAEVSQKLVGISQRRTKDFARFQCTVYMKWSPEVSNNFLGLLNTTQSSVVDLKSTLDRCVAPLNNLLPDVTTNDVVAAFLTQLARY